ncbi:MAG: PaaI family thioesterase [Gammaproteobacteria bacterium]
MNGTVPNKDFDAMVRKILLGMPYLQWLGLIFVHIAPGEVDFAMPLRHEITFDGRAVQAGPIGSLLDFAGGAAAFTLMPEGGMLATSDFTVKLLAPAVGESFVGRGRVVSANRSTTVCRADVFAIAKGAEKLVATGLVSMRALSRG